MNETKKKLSVADKIALVVLIVIIVFILAFWREIFSFLCYTNICRKYLCYQDMIQEAGGYTAYTNSNMDREVVYFTPKIVLQVGRWENEKSYTAQIYNTVIDNTQMLYMAGYDIETGESKNQPRAFYSETYDGGLGRAPIYPSFRFDKKFKFWDLLANFKEIRYITIDENDFIIDYKNSDNKVRLKRDWTYAYSESLNDITIRVGEVPEDEIEKVDTNADNLVLFDYELPNRVGNGGKVTTKLSNCDQEAGTVASYEFIVSKDESSSLNGFMEKDENIAIAKATNNTTYKRYQLRWKGLRDLTDEDFINYSVIIIVNKDSSKQMHYKDIRNEENLTTETIISVTEEPASSEYQYSAILLIVPNSMEGVQTPYHASYYKTEVVNN